MARFHAGHNSRNGLAVELPSSEFGRHALHCMLVDEVECVGIGRKERFRARMPDELCQHHKIGSVVFRNPPGLFRSKDEGQVALASIAEHGMVAFGDHVQEIRVARRVPAHQQP